MFMPPGVSTLDPSMMVAMAQRPELAGLFDQMGIPAPTMQLNPNSPFGAPQFGDILGAFGGGGAALGGMGGGGTIGGAAGGAPAAPAAPAAAGGAQPQVAKPAEPHTAKLIPQNAPQVGKMPGNPLMELLMASMLGGARPGLGGGR